MLINTDSEEFQKMSIIRQKQMHYENTGDFVRARKSSDIFNQLLALLSSDLVKQIDEDINGDDYAQEQIDSARTLGAGE